MKMIDLITKYGSNVIESDNKAKHEKNDLTFIDLTKYGNNVIKSDNKVKHEKNEPCRFWTKFVKDNS